jgi:hypothetical protein
MIYRPTRLEDNSDGRVDLAIRDRVISQTRPESFFFLAWFSGLPLGSRLCDKFEPFQSEQILRQLWRSKDQHPAQVFRRISSAGLTKSELLKRVFRSLYSKPLSTLFFMTL